VSFKLRPTKNDLITSINSCNKLKEVAELYDVSQQSIIKWMKFHDIFETHNFKRNIGKNKPWQGKHLPVETKEKIRNSKTGVILGPRIILEILSCPICGKEFKRGGSRSTKKFCSDKCSRKSRKGITYIEQYGEEKSFEIIAKFVETMCAKGMFYVSKPHRMLKDAMIENGLYVGFETSQQILYFEIDELNKSKKIAIEVDGDYWHNLPKKIIADKRKNTYLINRGYRILRFWEHEIYNELDKCLNIIKEEINATN